MEFKYIDSYDKDHHLYSKIAAHAFVSYFIEDSYGTRRQYFTHCGSFPITVTDTELWKKKL